VEQIDLFELLSGVEKKELEVSRADYPDIMTITEDDPLRTKVVFWATDYTWHMAVHECEGLLASRKMFREENPQSRYIKPVIYCNAWNTRDGESWNIAEMGHSSITACPHCGVDLKNGKGTIIIERRFKDRPYQCVYERELPELQTLSEVADAITEQLTPEEIQEVIQGKAEVIIENELRCHKCNEMPEFEPHDNALNGQTWFAVWCKCGRLPKDGFLFGNMEDALEGWRNANQINPLCPICHESPRFEVCEGAIGPPCYKIRCKCGVLPKGMDYSSWESVKKSFDVFSTKERALEYWKENRNEEVTR